MTGKNDMFSLQSEEISHRILSFLTIDDMFRLSATSKRCRNLFLSAKSLNIDLSKKRYLNIDVSKKRDHCICPIYTSLIRFFGRRSRELTNLDISTRHTGCFLCNSSLRERDQFLTLLLQAVQPGLQKLYLRSCVDNTYCGYSTHIYLPMEIYHCVTLTDFGLDLQYENYTLERYFDITSAIPFVNLRSLQLKNLAMEGNFGEWVSACTTLEKLELENVGGEKGIDMKSRIPLVNLRSLKLKRLSIKDNFGEWISACTTLEELELEYVCVKEIYIKSSTIQVVKITGLRHELCSLRERVKSIGTSDLRDKKESTLKIMAPNLEFFKWHGEFTTYSLLDKAMSLKYVELCLEIEYTDHSCIFCNILGSSMNTKELILDGKTVKKLYEYDCLNSGAYDVKKLCIVVDHCLENYFFPPAIAQLLRGIKNLKSLCIQSKPGIGRTYEAYPPLYGHGFDMKYWEWNLNLKTFVELEEVKIEVFKGGNELELAKYLLKNAKQLKEMTLIHSSDCPDDRLSKFKKMVSENLPSSEVSVVFEKLVPYKYDDWI